MLMPINCIINAIGCPANIIEFMKSVADKAYDKEELNWNESDSINKDMRGNCIILYGADHLQEVAGWLDDTAVIVLNYDMDVTMIRQGYIDVLPLPLDEGRFAAAFSNMITRGLLKKRFDMRENMLKTYFEISDDMLWTKDMNDLHMDINHILLKLVGKPREQIEGKHEIEIYGLDPNDEGCGASDNYVRTTGKTELFEESMPGADGESHHLRVTKSAWLDGQGRIIGTVGLAKDVTELLNEQTKFETFLDSVHLGVVIVDNDNQIIQSNSGFLKLIGKLNLDPVGQYFDEIIEKVFVKDSSFEQHDYILNNSTTGERTIWNLTSFKLQDYWGNHTGYTYIMQNVTREREQTRRIKNMAVRDSLTGVANRAGIYEFLDTLNKNDKATFMFIDMDNFKLVNDTYGHNTGDKLLKDVSAMFCRDIPDSFVARIGGDEFFIIVTGEHSESDIITIADSLLENISAFQDCSTGLNFSISLSMGILYQFRLNNDIDEIIGKCDKAMYEAKKTGKARYCIKHDDRYIE